MVWCVCVSRAVFGCIWLLPLKRDTVYMCWWLSRSAMCAAWLLWRCGEMWERGREREERPGSMAYWHAVDTTPVHGAFHVHVLHQTCICKQCVSTHAIMHGTVINMLIACMVLATTQVRAHRNSYSGTRHIMHEHVCM